MHADAIRLHGSRLSDYERQEIDKYPEIWFLGLDACKINAKPGTALNSGYDDDNGSYNKVNQFELPLDAGRSISLIRMHQSAAIRHHPISPFAHI